MTLDPPSAALTTRPLPPLPDSLRFDPAPSGTNRADGWTTRRQVQFIYALAHMGNISSALQAVGKSRTSAYKLRARPGAESFVAAWDMALEEGRERIFDYAMDRAMNGVTTVRIMAGGHVEISGGVDRALVSGTMRSEACGGSPI